MHCEIVRYFEFLAKNYNLRGPFFSKGGASDDSAQLGLANLGGVFIVLLGGMISACIIAVGEFMWENRLLISDENVRLINS